ncbi:MAG: hypothetical protein AAFV53_11425 [Myxococcota bacterium]
MLTMIALFVQVATAEEPAARQPAARQPAARQPTARQPTAQESAQTAWRAAAAAGDKKQLVAICTAAGGELQLKNGGNMAQPGMDMASMMMANMMTRNMQQATCTSGRETITWDATDWDRARIEAPKTK